MSINIVYFLKYFNNIWNNFNMAIWVKAITYLFQIEIFPLWHILGLKFDDMLKTFIHLQLNCQIFNKISCFAKGFPTMKFWISSSNIYLTDEEELWIRTIVIQDVLLYGSDKGWSQMSTEIILIDFVNWGFVSIYQH